MFKLGEKVVWNFRIVRTNKGLQNFEVVKFVGYINKTLCVIARTSLFSMEDRIIVNVKELHHVR